jgi:2-C-methyl-D-erythritol 4-phosphate cytidylyltransferase/2-C-methyl-D-erythritol 2,4-cyclodiphosphate synthase
LSHRVAAIIAAAGSGERLGARAPKALIDVGGRTLVDHAVSLFDGIAEHVIICAPSSHVRELSESFAGNAIVTIIAGGSTRSLSVRNAISVLTRDVDYVLVHDAARALAPREVVDRILAELQRGAEGVVPVLPVVDTIKEVMGEKVVRTVDRSALQRVQTPQGFRSQTLIAAHAAAKRDGVEGTDDASLVERIGIKVATVAGDERAFKITTPFDWEIARALAGGR